MDSGPVLALLVLNTFLLLVANFVLDRKSRHEDSLILSVLFFCSGMPALIYQVVWQRALFAIYGVNAQSVAVVVTAFMVGLGLGSLLGGRLSARIRGKGILVFGLAEVGVALFGLASLRIFQWAASYTAGVNLPSVVLFSLLLLLIPTVLMGATLPLLVEHLVLRTDRVGFAVSRMYFVNTFGSAVACYLCATFLLRDFGQSGSVAIAACLNAAVGASAYIYSRRKQARSTIPSLDKESREPGGTILSLPLAMLLAGLSGFIALGFEIAWFRVFSLASSDRAPAFALLLATYLAGIAAGSFISEQLTENRSPQIVIQVVGGCLILAGALSVYLPPLVAALMAHGEPYLYSAPAFFLTAALAGSVLPLLCRLSISADEKAGRSVSFIYVSNILGSAIGSLGIGFVLMQYFGLRQIALGLGCIAVLCGALILVLNKQKEGLSRARSLAIVAAALIAVLVSAGFYSLLFERLIFGKRPENRVPFAHVIENRNGVIGVTRDAAVFGGGVYDGYFNIDPIHDKNLILRAYALSGFCPHPKHILVIGLATASYAQVFANQPGLDTLDAVEINPGYLRLIPQYSMVRSFLENPKVHIYIDDGRRWLVAHPEARYDAIIANTTYNWRDHSTGLLSVQYLHEIRKHLNPGGVYYFNTTEADETIATALEVFPHGLRVLNFVVVSDTPIVVNKEQWREILHNYKIDGERIFDFLNPAAEKTIGSYMALADTATQIVNGLPLFFGFESTESLRARTRFRRIITDDNMGQEWRSGFEIPWH